MSDLTNSSMHDADKAFCKLFAQANFLLPAFSLPSCNTSIDFLQCAMCKFATTVHSAKLAHCTIMALLQKLHVATNLWRALHLLYKIYLFQDHISQLFVRSFLNRFEKV